jgi:nucleoside-specific outer membrane channel protein Tsx
MNSFFASNLIISEKIHTETIGSKNWWNLVKSLLGDYNNRSIPPIQTDDDIIHDDAEKSQMFNDLFDFLWRLLTRVGCLS